MFEIVGREEQVFEQWEQGVTLSNPCMKAGDEVVFRNSSGATYVMIAREESGAVVCDVPNKLLQMCCNILVDLEQGNDRHTECRTTFTVNPAQKPDGYKCVDNSVPDTRISFNDLKDKPFYEEKAVLFDGKVEFSGTGIGVEQRTIPQLIPFSVGDVIKVTWNGVEYECIAFDSVAMGGPGSAAVGNPFLLTGVDTGEPFAIGTSPESGVTVVFSYTKITEASIKIEGTKVKTIDPKFLPDAGFKVNVWYEDATGDYTADKTYAEIRAAEEAKTPIVGTLTLLDGKVFTMIGCDDALPTVNLVAFNMNRTPDIGVYHIFIDDFGAYVRPWTITAADGNYEGVYPDVE